jgi:hypothetical protein
MKKLSLILGVAVLLLAAMLMMGCEQPTDGRDGTDGTGPTDEQLDEALARYMLKISGWDTDKVSMSGSTATLKENVDISNSLAVPAGVTLAVPAGVTLTVDSGATLTVAGSVTVLSGATLKVHSANAPITGDGNITVENGGTLYNTAASTSVPSVATTGATFNTGNDGVVTLVSTTETEITSGTVTAGTGAGIMQYTTGTVAEEATLVIPANVTFAVAGTLTVNGSMNVNGTLVIDANATITKGESATVTFGEHNESNIANWTQRFTAGTLSISLSEGKEVFTFTNPTLVDGQGWAFDEGETLIITGAVTMASGSFDISNNVTNYTLDLSGATWDEFAGTLYTIKAISNVLTGLTQTEASDHEGYAYAYTKTN